MNNKKKIDIIGGGPAGLSVGYYARKIGMNVTIYESTSLIGGNCKTIIDGEFRYDTGAHRLHDKDSTVTNEIKSLLGDSLLKVSSPSKIYFEGRFFNFPSYNLFVPVSPSLLSLFFLSLIKLIVFGLPLLNTNM